MANSFSSLNLTTDSTPTSSSSTIWATWVIEDYAATSGTATGSDSSSGHYSPEIHAFVDVPVSSAFVYGIRNSDRISEQHEAEKNARKLLLKYLTPEQADMLEKQSKIVVETEERKYTLIADGDKKVSNVRVFDKQTQEEQTLCIIPVNWIPMSDHILSQLLMIQLEEPYFLKTALRARA